MGGRASRQKGMRREYQLRDLLRLHGWTNAHRVPASGASQGFKGDVTAEHPKHGHKKFEVKSRKGTFDKIYQLYAAHVNTMGTDLLSFSLGGQASICVDLSSSLEAVLEGAEYYLPAEAHPCFKQFPKTFRKVHAAQSMLQGSDILVLKGDNQCFLFLRFR